MDAISYLLNFTIIFIHEINGGFLKLPSHISIILEEAITLRDKYRNTWQIQARKVDGQWFLLDGWSQFVADTSIGDMDLITFSYSSPGLFDMNIFRADGHEKEGVGYCKIDSQNATKGSGRAETELREDVEIFMTPNSIKFRKRITSSYLRNFFMDSGKIPWHQCKYFITPVKSKRMNQIYIPMEIVRDENLKLPKQIKLVDIDGNTYTSALVKWTGDRHLYKGGWNRLCTRNRLTKDDFCICEFGEGDKTGSLFISFIREVNKS